MYIIAAAALLLGSSQVISGLLHSWFGLYLKRLPDFCLFVVAVGFGLMSVCVFGSIVWLTERTAGVVAFACSFL